MYVYILKIIIEINLLSFVLRFYANNVKTVTQNIYILNKEIYVKNYIKSYSLINIYPFF